MIRIKNAKNMAGEIKDYNVESDQDGTLDGEGKLTILPALIDPHVHFRTPGAEHKENWITGADAAITGGVTTVFDMPNNNPSCSTLENLRKKKELINSQLETAQIPLRYYLYFGADKNSVNDIIKAKNEIIGVKIYMGSSTGGLLMDDDASLDRIFQVCAQANLIVTVHAEDEELMHQRKMEFAHIKDPSVHSKIRNRDVAVRATEKAISLAEKYSTELCIAHLSTKDELEMVRQAKARQLLVYAEVTPHHLFLNEKEYSRWGTLAQMNPPLRTSEDQEALWQGINDGTVDFIGSDHAPHTIEEKNRPYGEAPSGVPGVETTLPLLLNAYNEGKISLLKIIELTRKNIETIFHLPHNDDVVLVDLDMLRELNATRLKTKCHWSPFAGRKLKGWPVYTIVQGKVFHV